MGFLIRQQLRCVIITNIETDLLIDRLARKHRLRRRLNIET